MVRRKNKSQISQPLPDFTSFNLDIRIVKSGKCGVAKPTETFWAAWRESKAHILREGFKVTKEKDWVVQVPINFVEKCSAPAETMPDHLENGLYSPGAADNLRHEHLDADGKEFLAIHGYIED